MSLRNDCGNSSCNQFQSSFSLDLIEGANLYLYVAAEDSYDLFYDDRIIVERLSLEPTEGTVTFPIGALVKSLTDVSCVEYVDNTLDGLGCGGYGLVGEVRVGDFYPSVSVKFDPLLQAVKCERVHEGTHHGYTRGYFITGHRVLPFSNPVFDMDEVESLCE